MSSKSIEQLRYELRGREIRREAIIAERMKLDLEIERLRREIADLQSEVPMSYHNSPLYGIAGREARREPTAPRPKAVEWAPADLEALL